MKKEVNKAKATRLTNPGNLILVSAAYKDKDTITTCAWHSPCSHAPACVGVALAQKHFSSELIRTSGEFVINVPSFDLKEQIVYCGSHSGRDRDKFKETGLTKEKVVKLSRAPKIKEAIASIECTLADVKEIGDHFVFFGQPLYAEAEEECFDFEHLVWKEDAGLIFHLGGTFFMRQGPRA
ncbi:flavin reductase family protein [Candidatus Omnitrophota bacterium]